MSRSAGNVFRVECVRPDDLSARTTQLAASRTLPVAGPQVEEVKSQRPQERVDVREERLIGVNRSEFDFDLDANDS